MKINWFTTPAGELSLGFNGLGNSGWPKAALNNTPYWKKTYSCFCKCKYRDVKKKYLYIYTYIHLSIYLIYIATSKPQQQTTTRPKKPSQLHHPTAKVLNSTRVDDSTTVGSRPVISEICCTLCLARCNLLAISATSSATGRMLPCKRQWCLLFLWFFPGFFKKPTPPLPKKKSIAIAAARFSHPKRKRSSSDHSFSGSSC